MQSFDSKQQSPQYRKRRCIAYKTNDFFEAFDVSQHEIISNYDISTQNLMIESLTIFLNNIRSSSNGQINEQASPKREKKDMKQQLYSLKKNLTFKKQNTMHSCDEDDSTNPQREIRELVEYEKTGKKPDKSTKKIEYCLEDKGEQPNFEKAKKHQKLLNSLKRLSVSQEFKEFEQEIQNSPQVGNNRDAEDTFLQFDMEAMKNKTISELISESNAKNKANKQYSPIQSENSQYEMTDHSSNSSSNEDGDYEEKFYFESNNKSLSNPIFYPGMSGKNFFLQGDINPISSIFNDSVQHPPQKLNFNPLLDSPKKSKSKKKRLYMNKKKVPRWAQDRQAITNEFKSEYQRKLREDANNIFGVCIVEDMQTNTIFNRKDQYTRSSTVRWDRQKKFVI